MKSDIGSRSTGHIAPKLTVEESGPQSGPFMDQTVEWSNPVGVPAELLHSYFVNFISGDLGPGRERSGARIRSGSEHDGKERIRAKNIQVPSPPLPYGFAIDRIKYGKCTFYHKTLRI